LTDEQLAIHLPLPSEAAAIVDRCLQVEEAVTELLASKAFGSCDGHDLGGDEFTLFIYTPDSLATLDAIRQLLPDDLLGTGAHAVIRRFADDEETTQRVELSEGPSSAAQVSLEPRAPLGFGVISGGTTTTNEVFHERIRAVRRRLPGPRQARSSQASLVVIWSMGGRFGPPSTARERVSIENRAQRLLGVTVPVPDEERTTGECDEVIATSLRAVATSCRELLARKKLDWDMRDVEEAIVAGLEDS
jgi:hypothetical protein